MGVDQVIVSFRGRASENSSAEMQEQAGDNQYGSGQERQGSKACV